MPGRVVLDESYARELTAHTRPLVRLPTGEYAYATDVRPFVSHAAPEKGEAAAGEGRGAIAAASDGVAWELTPCSNFTNSRDK